MATAAEQTHCDRCHAPLARDAAYCEQCGERTRRARRLVRLSIRIELLFVALVAILVLGFAFIFYFQKT
jgi:predicted nucleic acid-binding Zn ribbon protein